MSNITFNDYSPPKTESSEVIDITIGVFFDGTLNNKNNTEERKNNSTAFTKNGKDDQASSYYNDWSNVARLWEFYNETNKLYIEGIGTDDKEEDSTMGFAYGTGDTGIRGKVRKGCEKIVDLAANKKRASKAQKIGTLTLDVYGFSRGAAAARNFVYEVSKSKYKAIVQTASSHGMSASQNQDSDGNVTTRDEFPRRGHLGLKLEEKGIEVDFVKVRFLGVFDTVSSYSKHFSISPDFSNDVNELSLNNIGHASKVVHYIAENEHRENFSITHTHVGVQKTFPGVHSDIGGSYNDGVEVIEEIETSWTFKSNLDPLKDRLVNEGWYKKEQLEITGGNLYWALQGTRDLKKTFSYIPLHFMAESSVNEEVVFKSENLENKYKMSDNELLVRVKDKLRPYVMGDGSSYKFKWFKDIHEKYENNKSSPNYQKELNEQKDLRTLRNEYLHWSARREGIGMDPTSDRKRMVY